jgi:hypothetical protein
MCMNYYYVHSCTTNTLNEVNIQRTHAPFLSITSSVHEENMQSPHAQLAVCMSTTSCVHEIYN